MRFEWDDAKDEANLAKHDIDFDTRGRSVRWTDSHRNRKARIPSEDALATNWHRRRAICDRHLDSSRTMQFESSQYGGHEMQ